MVVLFYFFPPFFFSFLVKNMYTHRRRNNAYIFYYLSLPADLVKYLSTRCRRISAAHGLSRIYVHIIFWGIYTARSDMTIYDYDVYIIILYTIYLNIIYYTMYTPPLAVLYDNVLQTWSPYIFQWT